MATVGFYTPAKRCISNILTKTVDSNSDHRGANLDCSLQPPSRVQCSQLVLSACKQSRVQEISL